MRKGMPAKSRAVWRRFMNEVDMSSSLHWGHALSNSSGEKFGQLPIGLGLHLAGLLLRIAHVEVDVLDLVLLAVNFLVA